jgi:hypothetical protein
MPAVKQRHRVRGRDAGWQRERTGAGDLELEVWKRGAEIELVGRA